ncbi:hypothetical protein [Roseinatronobacter sp. S2]|uniref:hypothetical protein n=1 Tax=Roseinatronobacter sp. S2 TaxID=3035471 RepID=UPI00240F0796|nr:hypothetical protein [Roseinatronobacter sp. S2]WFE76903.1 hypothetical protein P8S53_17830 [Roseinatronobacter sp. S2]
MKRPATRSGTHTSTMTTNLDGCAGRKHTIIDADFAARFRAIWRCKGCARTPVAANALRHIALTIRYG